jgi:hypothetical protein
MLAVMQRRGPAQELRATIDRLPLHVRQAVLDGIKGQRIIAGAHADGSGGVCPMVAADIHLPWREVNKSSVTTAQEAARAWDRYADASGSSHTATKRQLLALTAMLEVSILQETSRLEMPLSDAIAEYERARSRRRAPEIEIPTAAPASLPALPPDIPTTAPARYLSLADAYEVTPEEPEPSRVVRPTPVEEPVEIEMAREVPVAAEAPVAPVRSKRERRNTGEHNRRPELEEREGWAWLRPFRSYDEYEETLLRALSELDSHERELEELKVR